MVSLLVGPKGFGKTKQLIDLVNKTVNDTKGAVICIERGAKLTYDIDHKARLIDVSPYGINGYKVLRGFITGLYASNYDINNIFIDSLFKVSGTGDIEKCEKFAVWCEQFGKDNNINFTITISEEMNKITDNLKKYII